MGRETDTHTQGKSISPLHVALLGAYDNDYLSIYKTKKNVQTNRKTQGKAISYLNVALLGADDHDYLSIYKTKRCTDKQTYAGK